jgi:replicative DNA helicase
MLSDYNYDVQKLFLEFLLQDAQCYVRVQNIFNVANFDQRLRPVAKFIKEHTATYSIMPDRSQVVAATGIRLDDVPDLDDGHYDWFLVEFENFTKRKELERAILKSADLLEKGEYGPVENLIKKAVQISLTKDMGTDYFANPKERLEKYFNSGGQVSTGWTQLDRLLYGGMSRGELNIFAGGSGSGKSLVMMNIALNWLSQGLSGIYITLELSEELASLRTDAMLTAMSTKDIRKDMDSTELKVRMASKKFGQYRVKYLPAQSNINDIRAYIKEAQIKTGIKADFIMVDYLDLLMPISAKVSPSDLFVKDKYVSEELRNLAKEMGILMITASQLNRNAVEEIEFDHSHIAGGISKINTADNVFGIFTSRAMKERGRYQIQCMKSRSSTGVGQKIDLMYDMETMKISDLPEDEQQSTGYIKKPSILDTLKTQSSVSSEPHVTEISSDAPPVKADVQSTRLKQLLNDIKSQK